MLLDGTKRVFNKDRVVTDDPDLEIRRKRSFNAFRRIADDLVESGLDLARNGNSVCPGLL
jgi:hypothetical protein